MRQGLSIGAAGAAVGLVVGVMLGSGKGGVVPLGGAGALGSSTSTSTSTGTGTSTGTDPEAQLAAAIERLDRAAAALEAAANAMKGSAAALGEARGAASGGVGTPGDAKRLGGGEAGTPVTVVSPGARPPGALVEWLPPEGVALVKAWYRRRWTDALEESREIAADPARNTSGFDESSLARRRRRAEERVALAGERLAALTAVCDELSLAKWLDVDEGGRGVGQPKPWQLAEFAKTWDGK